MCLHYEIITTSEYEAKILIRELGSRLKSAFAYYAKAEGFYPIKAEDVTIFIVKVLVPVIDYDMSRDMLGVVSNSLYVRLLHRKVCYLLS